MAKQKRQDSRPKVWVIVLILVGLFFISTFIAGMIAVFADVEQEGNVAIIPLQGVITTAPSATFFAESVASSTTIVKDIEKAEADPAIQGVIFEINSPGGSAVATEEISRAIERMEKPSVSWIREVGASGAYWAASQTDHIVASRMSVTGSVGVISSYLEFSGLMDDYNVSYERLVAGKYKDTGTPFRSLKAEERLLLQQKLDTIHTYFLEQVKTRRNLTQAAVEEIETGIFFLGSEAFELGLVDELGGRPEAVAYLEAELNSTVQTKRYEHKQSIFDAFGVSADRFAYAFGHGFGKSLDASAEPLIRT